MRTTPDPLAPPNLAMTSCRLIVDHPALGGPHRTPADQMAVDETLLKTAAETGQPTLRFYGWTDPTLSLGYFQRADERQTHTPSQNCPLVRRASGGGAIVHDQELTYCFATAGVGRFSDSEFYYLVFHETLVELLGEQGITAKLQGPQKTLSKPAFLCFQRRTSGDVTLAEHKIMGSAQRRWRQALVQHGSLLWAQSVCAPELPGLRDLAHLDLPLGEFLRLWQEKLASRLKTTFRPAQLSDIERVTASDLAEQKFAADAWTYRR